MPSPFLRPCAHACLMALAGLLALPGHADWDEAAEARDRAAAQRAAEADRVRQAAARTRQDAAARTMERGYLGKAAEGKSDAQVQRLYEQKRAQDLAQARAAQAGAPAMMQNMQQMLEGVTLNGKPITQASQAEIEAWNREMQRQVPANMQKKK